VCELHICLSAEAAQSLVGSVEPSVVALYVAFLRSTARPNIYNNFFVNGIEGR